MLTHPIDVATQVPNFTQSINPGHQSLEDAFAIALREDYSVFAARPPPNDAARSENKPEPMDIDVVVAAAVPAAVAKPDPKSTVSKNTTATKAMTCFHCR